LSFLHSRKKRETVKKAADALWFLLDRRIYGRISVLSLLIFVIFSAAVYSFVFIEEPFHSAKPNGSLDLFNHTGVHINTVDAVEQHARVVARTNVMNEANQQPKASRGKMEGKNV